MTQIVLYPGTFDPVTNGHYRLIEKATRLFGGVIVAVSENISSKKALLSFPERIALCQQVLKDLPGVSVAGFSGLLADFFQKKKADFLVRGLRGVEDAIFELQLAAANQALYASCETVFLRAAEKEQVISSSFVREVFLLGGDISPWVPQATLEKLRELT